MSQNNDIDAAIGGTWSKHTLVVYGQGTLPSTGTYDANKLEEKAREVTKGNQGNGSSFTCAAAFLYTFGSAGLSSTDRANRKAIDRWRIIPRMLRDASTRSLDTTIFGVKYKAPVFVAPVGVQSILHPDGELASAAAGANVGIPIIMSTASSYTIEQVATANGNGQRWYQLYWPVNKEVTVSLLQRAKKAGFTTLVVTLDTMVLGWRPHDLDTAYLPFFAGVGTAVGISDPAFMAVQGLEPITEPRRKYPLDMEAHRQLLKAGDREALLESELGKAWIGQTTSGVFKTWEDLTHLRENWEGPIVLKGIQCVEDARLAIGAGMDGIVVSNHGGRQVDGAIPSFVALEQVCGDAKIREAQEAGKFTVLFDSGIRTGSDVIKALAMGAQGVLVARPMMYGLAIAGQKGVEDVFRGLLAETEITLGLSGYKSVADVWGKRDEVLQRLDWLA
ncbi:FMN-dependent dehydrogenase [Vararia minispora EC-137]|uniref:FMN-dependent dehydrogenase n=1 Tax=Vararia minispora EC-137 TaxID=1314806 RepID=A0ACB8Q6T3_9AGAM|nr:FMN-dependent dehydrogenase [Vararia minispora EC-137]